MPCDHYSRNCDILASCCKQWYSCRICHDNEQDHELDRTKTRKIKCNNCNKIQPVSNKCEACDIKFASYFCKKCNLWTESKDVYHCDKCGICRKGDKRKTPHCDNCGICMPKNHKCNQNEERTCPICLADLQTSTEQSYILKCGHWIHYKCLNDMLAQGDYKCPFCRKAMVKVRWNDREANALERLLLGVGNAYCNECNQMNEDVPRTVQGSNILITMNISGVFFECDVSIVDRGTQWKLDL